MYVININVSFLASLNYVHIPPSEHSTHFFFFFSHPLFSFPLFPTLSPTSAYDFFTFDQIARALLPPSVTVPAGFAITGHVAHLNLRKQQLPYRRLIGELIVEKVTGIRTVVNKIGSINNVYRNFCAEVIGGEPVFVARVKEQNATFEFDFSAVYWNSRLQVEHSRVVALVKPTEVCRVIV